MTAANWRWVSAAGASLILSTSAMAQEPSALPYQNPEIEKSAPPLKAGANSFTEAQARALLASQGYTDVSSLMNGADGIWRGAAVKDQRKLSVSVDFKGHVAEN